MFNKISVLSLSLLVFAIISCSKEKNLETNSSQQDQNHKTNKDKSLYKPIPSSGTYVTYSSGIYTTSFGLYGGGVNFGPNLPHPTTSDPSGIHDGEQIPTIESVSFNTTPTLQTSVNGAYFSAITPLFGTPPTDEQIRVYFRDLNIYWLDPASNPRPTLLGNPQGSNGVKEIRGLLVRDHNSPTQMSVVDDTYIPQSASTTTFIGLGNTNKSGYMIVFWGPTATSGTVNKITVNGSMSSVSTYSLTYVKIAGGYSINGNIKLVNGTILSFVNQSIAGS